ncbi:MAG: hypothetical protein ACKV2U_06345 [Bryobacteraceae bacterium]
MRFQVAAKESPAVQEQQRLRAFRSVEAHRDAIRDRIANRNGRRIELPSAPGHQGLPSLVDGHLRSRFDSGLPLRIQHGDGFRMERLG